MTLINKSIFDKLKLLHDEISLIIVDDICVNDISLSLDLLNYSMINKLLSITNNNHILLSITNNSIEKCTKCNKKADYKSQSQNVFLCWCCSL